MSKRALDENAAVQPDAKQAPTKSEGVAPDFDFALKFYYRKCSASTRVGVVEFRRLRC